MKITYEPIGIVHSPFTDVSSMPIQPTSEASREGMVEIYPAYVEGLQDVDGFSHLILLYHMHAVRTVKLSVIPFLDTVARGVFATRAPTRPNPIGLSIVRLVEIEGGNLKVDHLDVLDGTPLLDIKPYVPEFDARTDVREGWLAAARDRVKNTSSDDRFT
ncbi:MAG: tRNA (N6-threonylcarbamoyladenosine(37)-N6)-methyltransferase TrmO [Anaerolineales bacterium]|jgi:tRNA-Thr(GGU) m(6)t(6)A37 methyltransferase TsaA